MIKSLAALSAGLAICLCLLVPASLAKEEAPARAPAAEALQGLSWTCIGPARGGRVGAVCGVRGDRDTYYMGACGGGVWQTQDAGHSWKNITDGQVRTGSVGAVVVAPSDPSVIYVGMGEPDPRGNFSHGDGVYRSTDAGKTWKHIGLGSIRQTGRIVVHPNNPDHVYVAALGHIWGPHPDRGVYESTDGGVTWTRRLYVDDKTGAIDLCMDPHNPRILYASMWQVQRKPWRLDSGGPGSGLHKSTDGGKTWTRLTTGLPKGILGRIGVSASRARPGLVYAMVEAEDGGVFRSEDGGGHWRRVNDERKLRQRAWYYSRIEADPQHADTVYVLNVRFHKSTDGGKSFAAIRTPHVDNHALWIDPDDNQRMVEGNDGGANVSIDGGRTWSRQDNQPTAQFYRVTTDNRFPYRVLGSQQDNSTVSVPHTSHARNNRDFHPVGGGEAGYIAVRPDNPDIIFGGSYGGWLTRYDHASGLLKPISPWPENVIGGGAADLDHRFQWTFPIVISPHDPNVLYVGGEVLWRSTDDGASWKAISPDLTTNDKKKQTSSGGPITQDNTTVEYHCTIFTIAPSPIQSDRIYVGTDDGRVHRTDDEGTNWTDITPKGLPKDALISLIEASPHDADMAWMAVTRYRSDDFAPYVYHTRDGGQSWRKVVNGLPKEAFVRSIREDPVRSDLLYAGTELGVFASFDGGNNWRSLQLNLPAVPVTDVAVKGDHLVIATQGRAFWILRDLTRLRQLDAEGSSPGDRTLLRPSTAFRGLSRSARIHVRLPKHLRKDARLEIQDATGHVVRRFLLQRPKPPAKQKAKDAKKKSPTEAGAREKPSGKQPKTSPGNTAKTKARPGKKPQRATTGESKKIKAREGWNVVVWDQRMTAPTRVPKAVGWPGLHGGPRVLPGTYKVVVEVNGTIHSETLELEQDPRDVLSTEQIHKARAFITEVHDLLDRVHKGVNRIRRVRGQVEHAVKGLSDAPASKPVRKQAADLIEKLRAVEDVLIQWRSKSPQDPLNYPVRLNDKLTMLLNYTNRSPVPSQGMEAVLAHLRPRAEQELQTLATIVAEDIPAFNKAWKDLNPAPVRLEKD